MNDEFLDEAVGVTALVCGIALALWKPAVLGALALIGLGALVYHEGRRKGGRNDDCCPTKPPGEV